MQVQTFVNVSISKTRWCLPKSLNKKNVYYRERNEKKYTNMVPLISKNALVRDLDCPRLSGFSYNKKLKMKRVKKMLKLA